MIKTLLIKDLKLYFSDKKGIIFTFMLPILLISLFTFAFGGTGKKNQGPSSLTLLIADEDQSNASSNLISTYKNIPMLDVKSIGLKEGTELVGKGKSTGVLHIAKGFQEGLANDQLELSFNYDAAKSIQVSILQSVLNDVANEIIKRQRLQTQTTNYLSGMIPDLDQKRRAAILNKIEKDFMEKKSSIKMNSVIKPEESDANVGLIQAVAGTSIMMLLFSIAAIGAGLLDEKETGTINRLLATPATINDILLAKMGSGFFIGLAQLIVLLLFAWLAFGLPIFSNIPALILLILCISFAVTSFGILLAAIAKSRQQLQGMSTIVILFMSAIGGSMVPLFAMPALMKKMAMFSVNYWGIQGFFDIFWRALPTIEILPKMAVLLIIGLIISIISIRLLNNSMIKSA